MITTFYKGDIYLNRLLDIYKNNKKSLKKIGVDLEYIIVNDSPWSSIQLPQNEDVILINNEKNLGIHQSRVNGLKKAMGEYVLFLDQDDELTNDAIISLYETIKDADIVIGNGIKEQPFGNKLIYRDKLKMHLTRVPLIYLKAANQIVSPGHCLIKKSAIPKPWKNNIMNTNGSDDLFLWLLMFKEKRTIKLNFDVIYYHKYVGDNLSNDLKSMCESDNEMCLLSRKNKLLPERYISKRRRLCAYIEDTKYTQKPSLKTLIKYPDIVLLKAIAYYI